MLKVVTSVTIFNDSVGVRMSITYSEIDESSGRVIADNKRIDRVIVDSKAKTAAGSMMEYAQTFVDGEE